MLRSSQAKPEITEGRIETIQNEIEQLISFESGGFADLFFSLSNDIMLALLGTYLTNLVDIINLAKTSTNRYRFYQRNQETILLNNLLIHAKLGEWKAARKIWTKCPDILKVKGRVKHRYLYESHTAYQIAWRNEEDDIIAEMNEILSAEEQKKQFDEIFPNGELIKHNWDFEHAKKLLQAVFDAVIKDTVIRESDMSLMNDETRIALQALYDYLNSDKSAQTGLVCDVRIYQQALSCYDYDDNFNNFNAFRDWNCRTFWCIRVEEMIATFLSTGYLRAHCQGIHHVVEEGKKVNDAGAILANGSSYFCCTENFLPGFHFFVNIFGRPDAGRGTCRRGSGRLLENLCRTKNIKLAELMPANQQASLHVTLRNDAGATPRRSQRG